jgi:hypothetical protein
MHRKLRTLTTALLAAALMATGTVALSGGAAGALGNTIRVPADFPTIQAAVDAATAPATTIIVAPGTYAESVVIEKSGITIRGAAHMPQPVIVPPLDTSSGCAAALGSLDGFCIFSFESPIRNVEIANLRIADFPGNGVIAFNAVGLNFHDNTVLGSGEYGLAAFSSSHSKFVSNWIEGPEDGGEAGVYVGDSPNASTLVRRNHIEGYLFGIFLRDSAHGRVAENTAIGNCLGILVLDTGSEGSVFDWTLVHNTADDNTKACVTEGGEGPPLSISGIGIALLGATHTGVVANHATGNFATGPTDFPAGGIIVLSSAGFGGSDPAYVSVKSNQLEVNAPAPDIFWDESGTFVKFHANECATSVPPGLC